MGRFSCSRDANGGEVLAPSFSVVSYNTPFIPPSHLLRTSSYINFFRIQCNFILYKYINIHTLNFFKFFPLFLFYFINYYYFFCVCVPGCSGMFLVLSTAQIIT